MQANRKEKLIFLAPAIIYLLVFSVFPLIYSIRVSLTDLNIVRQHTGYFIGLKNYIQLFADSLFLKSILNTLKIILIAIPVELCLGYAVAHMFYTVRKLKGVSVFRTIYLVPIMITPLIHGLTWSYILNPLLGIMNYLLPLIKLEPLPWFGSPNTAIYTIIGVDVWQWTPFVAMLILIGLLSIPQETLEAAEVDGAKWYQKIINIEIPMIKKVLGIAVLMRLIDLVRMFDIIYATTKGGPGSSTEVITMFAYRQSFNYFNIGMGSAASIIALISTILLSTFFIKYSGR